MLSICSSTGEAYIKEKALRLGQGGVVSELRERTPELRRVLLKVDVHRLFAAFHALDRELQRDRRLPRASRAHDERCRPRERAAAHELVESRDAGRQALRERLVSLGDAWRDEAPDKGLEASPDRCRNACWPSLVARSLAASAPEKIVRRVRRHRLPRQLHDRVGHRELGQAADVVPGVYSPSRNAVTS